MQVPKQTAEIFELLRRGQFINSNSTDSKIRVLYSVIDENFDALCEYFEHINFQLVGGNEYYMFTRQESRADLERKLDTVYKWIDMADFLKTFDNSFGPGTRFAPHEILKQVHVDIDLKNKLEGLKNKYASGKEKHTEILEKVLDLLVKDNFIELENPITGTYKTMTSFDYLEQLVMSIAIPENVQNEIPE